MPFPIDMIEHNDIPCDIKSVDQDSFTARGCNDKGAITI